MILKKPESHCSEGMRVAVCSAGCRSNQEEMSALAPELSARGMLLVENVSDADIVVFNTCSVTAEAQAGVIRRISSIVKEAPTAGILVTGCLAQQIPEELAALPNVVWVVGNAQKASVPDILGGPGGIFHRVFAKRGENLAIFDEHIPKPGQSGRTRFSVKIQEGCDFRCAYCIVPDLRGPSRSATYEGVMDRIRRAAEAGYREIVLTGTHIGQFIGDSRRLPGLVSEILKIKGDFRLRLSSLDPRDASDELFDLILSSPRICRHLHVSVQSLSPKVISAMGRASSEYEALERRLVSYLKNEPLAGLGADIISGFPGESDEHSEETLAAVKRIGFNYAHLFRYSKRPGTPAASMADQVDEAVKTARSRRLRDVVSERRAEWIRAQIADGVVHRIIVEHGSIVGGVTDNHISVEAASMSVPHNEYADVQLVSYDTVRNRCVAVAADRQGQ